MAVVYGPENVAIDRGQVGGTYHEFKTISDQSVFKATLTGLFYSPGPNGTSGLDEIWIHMRAHTPYVGSSYVPGYSIKWDPISAATTVNLIKTTASVISTVLASGSGHPPDTLSQANGADLVFNVGSLSSLSDISASLTSTGLSTTWIDNTSSPAVDATFDDKPANGDFRVRAFDCYIDNYTIDSLVPPPDNSYIIETMRDSSGNLLPNGEEFDLYLYDGADALDSAPIATLTTQTNATGTDGQSYTGAGLLYYDLGDHSLSANKYILRSRPPASSFSGVETIMTTEITPVVPT